MSSETLLAESMVAILMDIRKQEDSRGQRSGSMVEVSWQTSYSITCVRNAYDVPVKYGIIWRHMMEVEADTFG